MVRIRDIASYLDAQVSGEGLDLAIEPAGSVVTNDSRRVLPGGIFVAITGAKVDGNSFVNDATKRGAETVISEQERPADFKGVWMRVRDARVALARAAALVHGYPSRRLKLVGVTGTNGKTTTAHLIESIFNAGGFRSAIMGTIGSRIGEENFEAEFTTPESPEIQDFLRRAAADGVTHAVMEVSSIALEMHRADELEFAAAIFTNLTQDHLDFHGTLEAYFASKQKLFDGSTGARPRASIINTDDPRGVDLKAVCEGKVLTYGIDNEADISIVERDDARTFGLQGLQFIARTPAGEIPIASRLVGRPHAYNILGAIGAGLALGLEMETIADGIEGCAGVAGRFERVSGPEDDLVVIVDYAHTPDALTNVLQTVRSAQAFGKDQRGRLITVMGCGGDRDRAKRPMMGEEAARLSDLVIATSDNPRSEDPLLILNDIRVGLDRIGNPYELIVDRREAILQAITQARPGDVLLIAGKGHETYQILADGKIDFDDRQVARAALIERRALKSRPSNTKSTRNGS